MNILHIILCKKKKKKVFESLKHRQTQNQKVALNPFGLDCPPSFRERKIKETERERERMGSIISSFLGGGATTEAAAATSSETSSSRILSFHSPARWQLHFNNSKDSSQLVQLLSFHFILISLYLGI